MAAVAVGLAGCAVGFLRTTSTRHGSTWATRAACSSALLLAVIGIRVGLVVTVALFLGARCSPPSRCTRAAAQAPEIMEVVEGEALTGSVCQKCH